MAASKNSVTQYSRQGQPHSGGHTGLQVCLLVNDSSPVNIWSVRQFFCSSRVFVFWLFFLHLTLQRHRISRVTHFVATPGEARHHHGWTGSVCCLDTHSSRSPPSVRAAARANIQQQRHETHVFYLWARDQACSVSPLLPFPLLSFDIVSSPVCASRSLRQLRRLTSRRAVHPLH